MPGVLMIESLAQAAAILLLDRDGEALEHARRPARRRRRQVPPPGRARRSRPPRGALDRASAAPIARVARPGAASTTRSSPRRTLVMALDARRRRRSTRPPTSIPAAVIGAGTTIGPHAVDRPARRARPATARSARRRSSTATPTIGDDTEIFPFASIGLPPQDLKYRGEPTRLVIGQKNVFREFVTDPSRHRRRRRRDHASATATCSWPTRTSRTTATSATTPSSATRATLGGHVTVEDFAHDQRLLRRAPVLPRRPPRLHRRLLGGHQGRAAVRQDGRQPAGAQLRPEHHRPGAPRHSGRRRSPS